MAPLRVALLVAASRGDVYDDMKAVTTEHLKTADPADLDITARFVYGARDDGLPPTDLATPLDAHYDTPESLIPGILDKSLAAIKDVLAAHPDIRYVVRTNASTWFHWDRLAEFLRAAPPQGLAAGYAPDQSHLCGCCIVLSRDVAERLVATEMSRDLIDDLAIAGALDRLGVRPAWVPRVDILGPGIVGHGSELGLDPLAAFHVRVKGCAGGDGRERGRDAVLMAHLAHAYATGARLMPDLLQAAARGAGMDLNP